LSYEWTALLNGQRRARALAMLRGKQVERPARKHDNLPF
jgi:hypothetical protein